MWSGHPPLPQQRDSAGCGSKARSRLLVLKCTPSSEHERAAGARFLPCGLVFRVTAMCTFVTSHGCWFFTQLVHEQVPHLLFKILKRDVKAADAKRLNQAATAGAFQILDFEQAESADSIEMILRVSMNPIMQHTAEGRRCIATFFDLGPTLARNLMGTIRAQIQMGDEAVLDAYGTYYTCYIDRLLL